MKELFKAFLKILLLYYLFQLSKIQTNVVHKNNAVEKNLLHQTTHGLKGRLIFAVQTVLKR